MSIVARCVSIHASNCAGKRGPSLLQQFYTIEKRLKKLKSFMIFYRWRRFIKKAQTYKVDKATRFKLCPSTKSYKMLCFSLQKTYLSSITNIDRKTNDTNWMEERSNALESELPVRDFDLLIGRISRHAENLVGIPTCGPRRRTSHISLRHPPPLSANPTKSGRSAEPEAAANRTGNGDLLVRLGQPMRPRKEEQSSVEGIDSPSKPLAPTTTTESYEWGSDERGYRI